MFIYTLEQCCDFTLKVLRPVFEDRFISRRAESGWPPRSWYHWTIICRMPSKISITPTCQRQLTLWRTKFVKPLVKYSSTQSMCLKIGTIFCHSWKFFCRPCISQFYNKRFSVKCQWNFFSFPKRIPSSWQPQTLFFRW